ncbi:hypothetical protein Bca101_009805 [Brassica carinata]
MLLECLTDEKTDDMFSLEVDHGKAFQRKDHRLREVFKIVDNEKSGRVTYKKLKKRS